MRIVRTCQAYPTQYDIDLDDGRYVYFRYRGGRWSLSLWKSRYDFYGDQLAEIGADYTAQDGTSGHMTHSEVMGLLEIALPTVLQKADQ